MPVIYENTKTLITGGCLSRPDKLLGATSVPGVGKITRALEGYLRAIRCAMSTNMSDQMVVITGPLVQYDIALTDKEAEMACGVSAWLSKHRLPALVRNVCYVGLESVSPYVVVSITVPANLADAMRLGILKASQEKTDEKQVGSTPVHTRIDVLYDKCNIAPAPGGTHAAILAHKAAAHLLLAMMAMGRAVLVNGAGFCPVYDMGGDDEFDEAVEAQATGAVIENRISNAEAKPLRDSVVTRPLTDEQEQAGVERGVIRPDAVRDADASVTRVSTTILGPPVVPCNAPLDSSSHQNEMLGLSRHLARDRPVYTDKARERFRRALAFVESEIEGEFRRLELFKDCKLPAAWSTTLKEATTEAAPFERFYKLCGFVKSGELGLKPEKLPRLIGNPGPYEAEAQAECISLFEQYFCHAFPKFMLKGLTMRQSRDKLKQTLESAKAEDKTIASCDFSAMDSSWDLEEKRSISAMIRKLGDVLIDTLAALAKPVDPTDTERIKWVFKTMTAELDAKDSILFSGERGTSILNRLLVLTLRTAEIARFRGEPACHNFWGRARRRVPRSEGDFDIGDGDDTAFDAQDYPNAEAIVEAYRAYGKTIEPVLSKAAIEVLSTYVFISSKNKFYALVKVKKNVERLCYAIRPTTVVQDGNVPAVTAGIHAEYATAAYQRAIACAGTPVVRKMALAVGDHHRSKAELGGVTSAQLNADDRRRRPELAAGLGTLEVMGKEAHDAVAGANCNGFVMEHWLTFSSGKSPPRGALIEAHSKEWMEADYMTGEAVINDDDLLNPEAYLSRCGWTTHIAESLGVTSPTLLKCCLPGASPSAPTRPAGGQRDGNSSSSRSDGGGSESKTDATATRQAYSRPAANNSWSRRPGHAGRSRRSTVAGAPNTDGVASVPTR